MSVSQMGKEELQAELKQILVALPGPLRSSQAIVTSQSSRESTELCLRAFWGIANP